jgi:phosphotransferase system  glucose/maltose/N-acetylglucosamine-specific IIC component
MDEECIKVPFRGIATLIPGLGTNLLPHSTDLTAGTPTTHGTATLEGSDGTVWVAMVNEFAKSRDKFAFSLIGSKIKNPIYEMHSLIICRPVSIFYTNLQSKSPYPNNIDS